MFLTHSFMSPQLCQLHLKNCVFMIENLVLIVIFFLSHVLQIWLFANSLPLAMFLLSHDRYQPRRQKVNTCVIQDRWSFSNCCSWYISGNSRRKVLNAFFHIFPHYNKHGPFCCNGWLCQDLDFKISWWWDNDETNTLLLHPSGAQSLTTVTLLIRTSGFYRVRFCGFDAGCLTARMLSD